VKKKIIVVLLLTLLDLGALVYLRIPLREGVSSVKNRDINEVIRENNEESFTAIVAINDDCRRLLYLSDRSLPIVVSADNREYLSLNLQGDYDRMGTLFQAKEVNDDSQNIVIYGHSSNYNNKRLTPLKNEAYIRENREFSLRDNDQTTDYRIIAYLLLDVNDPQVAFYQANWRNDGEFQNYLKNANRLSRLDFDLPPESQVSQCLTLVTCDLRKKSRRWVVVAIPIN